MATTKGFTKKMMGCSPSEQAIKNECIRNIISSVKHSNRSSRNKQSPNGRVDQLPPLFSEGKQGVSSRLDSYNFKLL